MRKVNMKKIALLAMLCVFSIAGIQSAQAVEKKDFDVKNRPQMERKHEHYKFENKGLTCWFFYGYRNNVELNISIIFQLSH